MILEEFLPPSASLSVALWRPLLAEPSIEPVDKAEKRFVDKAESRVGLKLRNNYPPIGTVHPFNYSASIRHFIHRYFQTTTKTTLTKCIIKCNYLSNK